MTLGSRIAGTVIVGVCWVVFALLWFPFFAGNFDFWQNSAIFLVSIIIAIGALAVIWIKWALK